MNRVKVAGVALVLCVSSTVYAQQSGNAPANSGTQSGTQAQPGQAGRTVDEPAAMGAPGNKPGTLMDKRANALSPQGASGPGRTGEVKQ
ncbi:hypothetical protein PQQ88_02615 [Paraburkholderia caledonica]|jgi:hypothetical protein|uniref:hypothetical protein n=1 Tax=Paraburkholderia caledonica TaxID=134536 RepID=UPI000D75D47E|nr:hypothetical protein [Paraburkholderia caledonica]AXF14111.1 hypothetical protein CUJ87_06560 [Paraburkholderia caledonica]